MRSIFLMFCFLAQFNLYALDLDDKLFVSAYSGPNWIRSQDFVTGKYKIGYRGALSVGYIWTENWSLAAEFSYRQNRLDYDFNYRGEKWSPHLENESYSGLINLYCNLYNYNGLIPYTGVGIGICHNRFTIKGPDKFKTNENKAALQAIFGLKKEINRQFSIGIEYRFFRFRENVYEISVGPTLSYRF